MSSVAGESVVGGGAYFSLSSSLASDSISYRGLVRPLIKLLVEARIESVVDL